MKKTLIITAVLALSLCLAAAAPAASGPLKNLCLDFVDYPGWRISLVVKLTGTTQTSLGPVKYYTLSGEMGDGGNYAYPVTGTGHMNGTKFHFSLTGSCQPSGSLTINTYDLSVTDYNFLTGGDMLLRLTENASVGTSGIYAMVPGDCKASVFPFDAEAAAALGPISLAPGQ
jgi:hypothetical protein